MVGELPDTDIPWRHNSLLQEYAIPSGTKTFDFGGGYMQGDGAGTIKMTMPAAWVNSMLAWGFLQFTSAYESSGAYNLGLQNIKWGSDYLLKTLVGSPNTPDDINIVYQVPPSIGGPPTAQAAWRPLVPTCGVTQKGN